MNKNVVNIHSHIELEITLFSLHIALVKKTSRYDVPFCWVAVMHMYYTNNEENILI